MDNILSILIWLPIVGGVLLLLAAGQGVGGGRLKAAAMAVAGCNFLLSLPLFIMFDSSTAALQFAEDAAWIDRYNIRYGLGVDGFSMPLIILNTFVALLAVAGCWENIQTRIGGYVAAFLIMSGLTNGVFAAADAALFYIFWEATLIPLFMIIGIWGGERRVYAALKFFLYTLLGSLLMLAALLYLHVQTGSFAIVDFHHAPLTKTAQALLFFAFLAAFAVKVPMTPVHTWLPDAHVEAPTGGSVMLAAIMLKLGAYGFLRFSLPVAPDASQEFAWLIIALSLLAIVYIGLVALAQEDMKKLIAYSSIAHMGFVTLGFFLFDELGMAGGIAQMISHGFVSGALFFGVGVVYDRMHTRRIADYGGVAGPMPKIRLADDAVCDGQRRPSRHQRIRRRVYGDFGGGCEQFLDCLLCATTLITGAAYTLWMYKRTIFGAVANDSVRALKDANPREMAIMLAFAALILLMGLWPQPLLETLDASVQNLLAHVEKGK